MKIDVHAHIHPESCLDIMPPAGLAANVQDAITDLPVRLRDMDAQGVDLQLLSVPPWLCDQGPVAATRLNQGIAEAVAAHPSRFMGLATVALEEPASAAAELERTVKELGFKGVEIMSNINGENLHERKFGVFYRKLEELDVPIFIHPHNVLGREDRLRPFYLSNFLGNPTDTAVAAACLIFGGVLKEFPSLKFILAHGGGSCPFLIGRWDHGWNVRVEGLRIIDQPPSEYFKLLYFDALLHSQPALEYLVGVVGADHVLLGSDYPFAMAETDPAGKVAALTHLREGELAAIFEGNARRLFKLG